ncbi:MAG: hypothetical protein M1824_002417 [Vezdaea acicularis]|nr:MAG: hypothetical protein M1824_002417 [Vezdaea acicularis]
MTSYPPPPKAAGDTGYPPPPSNGYDGYSNLSMDHTEDPLGKALIDDADQKLKKRVRIFKFLARSLTFILSIAITGNLAKVLGKYLATKGVLIGGRNAWAKDTKLWPTIMLLVIAVISAFINSIIMLAYCWRSVKHANRASMISTLFTSVIFVVHIVIWIVTAALYKYGKDTHGVSNDLWGWTCSSKAFKIQPQFQKVVDFDQYCSIQTNSFRLSVAQAVAEIFGLIVWFFVLRRISSKRKIKRIESEHIPVQNMSGQNF